jgi:hypothetical protein
MALATFSIKHGRTQEDAKARLAKAVEEVQSRYGPMIQKVEWSPDGWSVTLTATGVVAEMRIDAEHVHAAIDVPLLGGLLGHSMAGTLKDIVQRQLGGPGGTP